MNQRNTGEDPEFGSDSFLDIIANIVGILIILIVIAGVKVARQPLTEPILTRETHAASNLESTLLRPFGVGRYIKSAALTHDCLEQLRNETGRHVAQVGDLRDQLSGLQLQTEELAAEESRLLQKSAQLTEKISSNQQEVMRSDTVLTSLKDETAELRRIITGLRDRSELEKKKYHAILNATKTAFARQESADLQLRQITLQTQKLKELIEHQQTEQASDTNRLEHRLSPVVRTDNKQELHFRLSEGQISWVPLEPLLERLKRQVPNRFEVIRRFGRYEGVCGPEEGYIMKYAVERHTPSPLERLNGVSSMFRVAVSRWTVTPVDSLEAEPVEEAIEFGSRYRQILEAADLDSLMTIWLYPDDFVHFGRLREFGHSLGLRVAARPLPRDAEISGSPGGSRSSGQ